MKKLSMLAVLSLSLCVPSEGFCSASLEEPQSQKGAVDITKEFLPVAVVFEKFKGIDIQPAAMDYLNKLVNTLYLPKILGLPGKLTKESINIRCWNCLVDQLKPDPKKEQTKEAIQLAQLQAIYLVASYHGNIEVFAAIMKEMKSKYPNLTGMSDC